jgi:hypothetical protein
MVRKLNDVRNMQANMQFQVHYGFTQKDTTRMLAVPYRYSDSPDESSNFADGDLTALLTIGGKVEAGWAERDVAPLREIVYGWIQTAGHEMTSALLGKYLTGTGTREFLRMKTPALLARLTELDFLHGGKQLLKLYCARSLLPINLIAHSKRKT